MKIFRTFGSVIKTWFILLLFPACMAAQGSDDCTSATVLCADQPQFSSNTSATVNACSGCEDGSSQSGDFCFELNNTVWFSFTTNDVGGDVNVTLSNITCTSDPGYNTSLQAIMISASSPCDESSYAAVSNCESGNSSTFTLSATALSAHTTYYIQVDGDSLAGDTNPAECGFNIEISGVGVEVAIDAGEGSTIFKGESASLEGSGPADAIWSPASTLSNSDSPSTTATPDVTTTYYYSTTTTDGCVYSDEVTVVVQQDLTITNTFSPNDDGYNDIWYVGSINLYPTAKVVVYDRWGQKVYNSVGYGDGKYWDGTFLGARLPSGVYYYIIDLNTSSDEDVFAGYVTLVR